MSEYIIAADCLSFIFISVILIGTLTNSKKNKKPSTKLFIWMLAVFLFAVPVDALSYLAEKFMENDSLLRCVNMLAYLFIVLFVGMFSLYLVSVIREKTNTSYRVLLPIMIITILYIVITIVGTVTGKLFTITNHKFCPGSWHILVYALTLIDMLYLSFVLFRYRKKLKAKEVMGLSTYLIFPFLLSLGALFFKFPDFTYATAAVSLLIIYMTIQAQTIAEVKIREQILDEVSHTDALTGLKNRRAYDEFLGNDDQNMAKGVAFFDLNGLKHTNDTYGHAAGDNLIKEFSSMLSKTFSDGEVFRISGDEFVVALHPDSTEMGKRMQDFCNVILTRDRMASFGYVYREKGNIIEMIQEAEQNMYQDKKKYYEETGKDRRI